MDRLWARREPSHVRFSLPVSDTVSTFNLRPAEAKR
jgi:hypothetical protein